jgi:hypothetical protein
MLRFNKNYKGRKNTKNVGNPRASCFRPIHHYQKNNPIIDDIFLSYNLVEHYIFSFLDVG